MTSAFPFAMHMYNTAPWSLIFFLFACQAYTRRKKKSNLKTPCAVAEPAVSVCLEDEDASPAVS